MRLISSPESVLSNEISVLAIFECIISICIYIYLCAYLNSWQPFYIAIILGPLFLLRTELSQLLTLNTYLKINRFYFGFIKPVIAPLSTGNYLLLKGIIGILLAFIFNLAIALSGILCRIIITSWCFIRFPLITLGAMPNNWIRQALCTDLFRSPEIIPGENEIPKGEVITFQNFFELMKRAWNESWFIGLIGSFVYLPILLLGFIPAYLLRISFKATSLIYVPFVWIVGIALNNSDSLKTRLEKITKSEAEKIRRKFSLAIFGIIAFNYFGIQMSGSDFMGYRLEEIYLYTLVLSELYPQPIWPYFFIIEIVITFALLLYCDNALLRINGNSPYSKSKIITVLSMLSIVRNVFVIFIISVTFVIALSKAQSKFIVDIITNFI